MHTLQIGLPLTYINYTGGGGAHKDNLTSSLGVGVGAHKNNLTSSLGVCKGEGCVCPQG